jgi:hypothetical protein
VKLEGSLDTFPLRELIDMVVYSSVTGVLNIYGEGEAGRLYFRENGLYHAARGQATGSDALAELFELSRAHFSFVAGVVVEEESLSGPLAMHLQTAERLAIRWRVVRRYVPRLELVPKLLVLRDTAWRRVNPAYHPALMAIDGQRDLQQIAALLSWSEIDLAEAAAQMSVDGVIELRSQRETLGLPVVSEESVSSGEGVFDRILARTHSRQPESESRAQSAARPHSSGEELILRMLRGSS